MLVRHVPLPGRHTPDRGRPLARVERRPPRGLGRRSAQLGPRRHGATGLAHDRIPLRLIHCPREYKRLEVEDAETGESLVGPGVREPDDFFHSGLAVNPSGTRFAGAGWLWHPYQVVLTFDLAAVRADGRALDSGVGVGKGSVARGEDTSAVWLEDERLVVGSAGEDARPGGNGIAVFEVANDRCLRSFLLDEPPGRMTPLGPDHVVAFYRHPRAARLRRHEDRPSARVLRVLRGRPPAAHRDGLAPRTLRGRQRQHHSRRPLRPLGLAGVSRSPRATRA
jgi:hypothetical protein